MAKKEQRCGKGVFNLLWLVCALGAMGIAPAQTLSEIVLHNFGIQPHGANPYAGLMRDSAGNLYGTGAGGGTGGGGVVFKVDTVGQYTVLYSFTGGADGGGPQAGVISDSAGNLYGTTYGGGTGNAGVVYKLDTAGQETVLYSFTGGTDGGQPQAGVIRDSAGNLYGTTTNGGTSCCGVVYKLDASGVETVLYSFTDGTDGADPYAGVIRDAAGNLYGTTVHGGAAGAGVVYRLDSAAQSPGGWAETVLYSFTGGTDGFAPYGGLISDSTGNLYGTTYGGGTESSGVVYKLDATGHETVLYSLSIADGANPYSGVFRDSAGNLYGTTNVGGTAGAGVVFELDTAGEYTVLHNFTSFADGALPYAGVVRDPAGNLYGTTYVGGEGGFYAGFGVVYKLDAAGQETVLYTFKTAAGGISPNAGVIRDSEGNLYGTTFQGGTTNAGVVYNLDTAGQETVLYSFTGGADGQFPNAGLIRDSAGNLYGTTSQGGTATWGVVYKVDTAGQETVLYTFTGGADGGNPYAGVIADSAGNLYGTASEGGTIGVGVVYKLDAAGQETVLYNFTGETDGWRPDTGVIRDSAGNLYGTADGGTGYAGVVYELDAAGQYSVLYTFTGGTDGGQPSSLIQDSSGNLYGTTGSGGNLGAACGGFDPPGCGVVFKLDAAGQYTVLYTFIGGADGSGPSGVVLDSAGNLYGAAQGGTANAGVVYKLDTAGQYTVLYSFTGGADGSQPQAGVILDSGGNLYGITVNGGKYSGGVVYVLPGAATVN